MQRKLREAEEALRSYLHEVHDGVSMEEILQKFRGKLEEPELRAAVWKLVADREAEIRNQKLQELVPA